MTSTSKHIESLLKNVAVSSPQLSSPYAAHLDSESESRRVEWVFSVQLALHCQGPAVVVQAKNTVGVPCMDGWIRERERKKADRDKNVRGTNEIGIVDNST